MLSKVIFNQGIAKRKTCFPRTIFNISETGAMNGPTKILYEKINKTNANKTQNNG